VPYTSLSVVVKARPVVIRKPGGPEHRERQILGAGGQKVGGRVVDEALACKQGLGGFALPASALEGILEFQVPARKADAATP
jgi:hypothetical protein